MENNIQQPSTNVQGCVDQTWAQWPYWQYQYTPYSLSEADVDRIAERVVLKLQGNRRELQAEMIKHLKEFTEQNDKLLKELARF